MIIEPTSLKRNLYRIYSLSNTRLLYLNNGYSVILHFSNFQNENLLSFFINSINSICGNKQFICLSSEFTPGLFNRVCSKNTSSRSRIFFCLDKIILFLLIDFLTSYKISFSIKTIFSYEFNKSISLFELSLSSAETLFLPNYKISIFYVKKLYILFYTLKLKSFLILNKCPH